MSVVLTTLREQEEIIEENLGAVFKVGTALAAIRGQELYREAGFDGFVDYLESKPWGISRSIAYEQIDAAQVSDIVGNGLNSRQARELAPLMRNATPDVVRQVYAEVIEETAGKPTAKALKAKVAEILPKKEPKSKHADYNRRIDEGVISKLRALNEARLEAEDWHSYSRTTLRRHIKVMKTSQQRVGEWIDQAEKVLGTMPAK